MCRQQIESASKLLNARGKIVKQKHEKLFIDKNCKVIDLN